MKSDASMWRENCNTIYDLLRARAEQNAESIAIVSPGRSPLKYRQLLYQVDSTLESLRLNEIKSGDRIAILLPMGPELATAFLSISSIATAIPLNPAYRETEFDFYLSDLNPRALIVSSATDSPARTVARNHGINVMELNPVLEAEAGIFNLTASGYGSAGPRSTAQYDDIALVLYTSGTTSKPKRVPLTHQNLLASAENIAASLRLNGSDRCLNVMPLYHIHGLVGGFLSSLFAGASVAIAPDFNSAVFFDWLDELRPTWYTAVPPMHHAILRTAKAQREKLGSHSLRFIRSSSAPLPAKLMAELETIFRVPVIQAYGMTEASHQIASNPLPPLARKAGSVGMPTCTEVAIMDEIGNLIATNEIGEVVLRGPNVTHGYEVDSAANQTAVCNGWFRTGDQGYFDNDGYLFLTGRMKEMINCGGAKIAPLEIEAVLLDHPAIADAVVFSVPHATLGEDVAAAVVLKSGVTVTTSELQKFAALRLADFKIPRRIKLLDNIPKSPTGKAQRSKLASQLGVEAISTSEIETKRECVKPRTELEAKVASIWCTILRLDRISVSDNFFDSGGDSIAAAEAIRQFREMLGVELPFISFFEAPTVADMASKIASLQDALTLGSPLETGKQNNNSAAFLYLIELQRGKQGPPIFLFPGGGEDESEFFYFMRLARHMSRDYQLYGFRARGTDGLIEPHSSVEEMAKDYLLEMQKLQPEGPYFLIGDCIGGAVAYEAARQLTASGQTIAALILLDSQRPTIFRYYAYRFGRLKEYVQSGLSDYWNLRRKFRHILENTLAMAAPPQRQRHQAKLAASASESIGQLQNSINPRADIRKAMEVYRLNLLRHKPKPYKGEIKLIVNEKWFQHNPTLGWGKITRRGVETHAVPGDHFTYTEIGERAKAVAQQLMKWIDEARGEDGNGGCVEGASEILDSPKLPFFWTQRLETAKSDLAGLIPNGSSFILVDQCAWGSDVLADRSAIPFLERDGQYWGSPPDDDTAIREFERLRQSGATFMVFAWPAFWWLDYYVGLRDFLQINFNCVLRNSRVVAFDLRTRHQTGVKANSYGLGIG